MTSAHTSICGYFQSWASCDWPQLFLDAPSVIIWACSHSAVILETVSGRARPNRCCPCTIVRLDMEEQETQDDCSSIWKQWTGVSPQSQTVICQWVKIILHGTWGLMLTYKTCQQVIAILIDYLIQLLIHELHLLLLVFSFVAESDRRLLACLSYAHIPLNINFTVYII